MITDDGKDGYKIEIPYEKAEADVTSTDPEELKKALHAGQIPEAYTSVIQDMKVETVRRKVVDERQEKAVYMAVRKKCWKRQNRIFCQRSRTKSGILSSRRNPETEMHKEKLKYPLCKQKCL